MQAGSGIDANMHLPDAKARGKVVDSNRELEFAVYCIENVANALGRDSDEVYRALTGKGDILHRYIIPAYDVLHTQGREYIVGDILDVMRERGVIA